MDGADSDDSGDVPRDVLGDDNDSGSEGDKEECNGGRGGDSKPSWKMEKCWTTQRILLQRP